MNRGCRGKEEGRAHTIRSGHLKVRCACASIAVSSDAMPTAEVHTLRAGKNHAVVTAQHTRRKRAEVERMERLLQIPLVLGARTSAASKPHAVDQRLQSAQVAC